VESFLWLAADAFVRFHDLPGREPALVLIHGLGASAAQAFVDVCRRAPLSDRRCVAPDLFGFGYSDRPSAFSYSIDDHAASLAALLDARGLRNVTLLGHSMGGAVAIVLARTRPDLVARLLLAEGHLDPTPGAVSGPVVAYSEADFARHGHADLVRTFVSQGLATYAGAFQVADPAAIHRTAVSLIAARRPTYRDMLLELPMPRVFFFGSKDLADPDARWLPEHGIPVRGVAGAGHDMMTDQPDAFVAAVAASLA
jgi:pimeloyl-ACP methyl ester carboxylesterase